MALGLDVDLGGYNATVTLHVTTAGPPIRALTMEPEVLRQFIAATLSPGIVGTADLAVGAPGGMFVSIASGFGVVKGADVVPTQGAYVAFNDASVNVAVTASNGTNPRIDLVILTIQDAFYQGAVNAPSFQVIAGTPAGSPVAPAIPVAYRDYILLASVLIPAASGSVTAGNITDSRVYALPLGQGGRQQMGSFPFTFAAQSNVVHAVTFAPAYRSTPNVQVSVDNAFLTSAIAQIQGVSATGFTFEVATANGANFTGGLTGYWIATGT